MLDLAACFAEALDRAEQLARAAGRKPWSINHHECDSTCDGPCEWATACVDGSCGHCVIEADDMRIYDEGGHDASQAAHIVAWQPQTVLRLVARDRATLADHRRVEPDDPTRLLDELRGGWCARCIPDDTPDATLLMPWPCPTVQSVAAFWLPNHEETP